MGVLGHTPVLVLAESIDRKYRLVARLGSFEIVAWQPISYGPQRLYLHHITRRRVTMSWAARRKIARRRVHRGKAGYEKLADFTFEEHQAVLSVFKRYVYAQSLVNDYAVTLR